MKSVDYNLTAMDGSSHPVRGAWIEISEGLEAEKVPKSHPVRGAWIEIYRGTKCHRESYVAPREGCVD